MANATKDILAEARDHLSRMSDIAIERERFIDYIGNRGQRMATREAYLQALVEAGDVIIVHLIGGGLVFSYEDATGTHSVETGTSLYLSRAGGPNTSSHGHVTPDRAQRWANEKQRQNVVLFRVCKGNFLTTLEPAVAEQKRKAAQERQEHAQSPEGLLEARAATALGHPGYVNVMAVPAPGKGYSLSLFGITLEQVERIVTALEA